MVKVCVGAKLMVLYRIHVVAVSTTITSSGVMGDDGIDGYG